MKIWPPESHAASFEAGAKLLDAVAALLLAGARCDRIVANVPARIGANAASLPRV